MKEMRYSKSTINSYMECLRIFFNFYPSKHYLEIDNNDIALFNRDYILKQKLSATYQGQFINAIKLFYEKIPRKRIIIEHIERPRKGNPLPKVVSKEDVLKLLSATQNIKHRTKAFRKSNRHLTIWIYKIINNMLTFEHTISHFGRISAQLEH